MIRKIEEILSSLVRVNSTNPPGNEKDVIDVILSCFPKDTSHEIIDHGNNRGSLIIEVEGNKKAKLGFVGHIDTVPVSDEESWKYPPFEAVVDNGHMYGRGSVDMKGGVTAMILTALHFLENNIKPDYSLKFIFTADEESGGLGVVTLRDMGKLKDLEKIIIPEPTNEGIGICEKGALWINVKAKGRSSHASKPELGINAIESLNEFINRLKATLDLDSRDEFLGQTSIAITKISGGVKTNIIPENAEASVDIRTIPSVDHKEILNNANRILSEMEEETAGLEINISVENNRPALRIEKDNSFIKDIVSTYEDLSYPVLFKGLNFYTDGSQIIPQYDIPFVILGPGHENMCHQRDENIELKSIERILEFYIRFVKNS